MYEFDSQTKSLEVPKCDHPRFSLRQRRLSNGVIVVCRQCLTCGHNCGNVKKDQATAPSLPWWDAALVESWQARMYSYWQQRREASVREQADRDREWWERYESHLQSEKWQKLRRLVLSRCNGVCEGCGERRAVHVHHKVYDHLGHEFLFELLGVCVPCHERIHGRPIGATKLEDFDDLF